MRRFFFFGSSTAVEGSGDRTPDEDGKSKHKKNRKTLDEGEANANSSSKSDDHGTMISRSRSRHGKRNNEEPSNPRQLRRCMSFSSAATATTNCLKERSFSFSADVPGYESDAPHHAEDVNHYAWSPERHLVLREHLIKVPKAHSVLETDSPGRCHSDSTGHSPRTSPVALRCRSSSLGNLLNKNEVLDSYIEGEQEAAIQNNKRRQNSPTRCVGSNSRKPPRPRSTVPSFQKSMKESLETYPNVNANDAYLHQLAQERANDSCKNTSLSNASKNYASVLDDFGRFPHVEDHKSESFPSVEDASETSLEMENRKLTDELEKVRKEHNNLHNSSVELHAQIMKAAEEKGRIRGFLKDKEGDNKALHQVVARLQTICNEQEKTIAGLRQGFSAELDKESAGCSSEIKSRMRVELNRLTGVEQKLRGEVQSRRLEVESLRQENIALLNRLLSTENGSSFSSIRLGQELQSRVDNLQIQGLSLHDRTSQLCTKLLDLVKCRRLENEPDRDIDALDYTLEFQSIKGGIENMKRSLRATNALLAEKQNLIEKSGEAVAGGSSAMEQKDELCLVDSEFKLKEEALLGRVLKEALWSKELDNEQLQSDVASLLRIQDVMRNEVQRVLEELSCITHKAKHMELQGSKKDESINQIQHDFQESAKELSSLRGQLKIVTDERDLSWQDAKQLRRTTGVMQNEIASLKKKIESLEEEQLRRTTGVMQNEIASLKKKIESLEEDILFKEGQISILHDNIYKPPLDYICSPTTMKLFGL